MASHRNIVKEVVTYFVVSVKKPEGGGKVVPFLLLVVFDFNLLKTILSCEK
jgi:hypothetical protein